MKSKKPINNSMNKAGPLPLLPGDTCAAPVSTNTKGNGGRSDSRASSLKRGQGQTTAQTVARFLLRLAKQKNPSADDLNRLRKQIVSTPDTWRLVSDSLQDLRQPIIERLQGPGIMRAALLAEIDILKIQMDYDSAPVLERMHIDHVLTALLRLRDAEIQFSHCLSGESVNVATARFRQDFLESAQVRYLRASEALARIRRLARNTPALQINIAQDGGQQVIAQGETGSGGK